MRRLLALSTAVALVCAPLAAAAADAATVVATVNGEAVTLGQMQAMLDQLGPQAAGVPPAALWSGLVDDMVRQTALAQEGAKALTAQDEANLALARRAYLATAALQKIAAAEPSEAEMQAVYDKAFGGEPKTEYNASHILVDSPEAAQAVLKDLAAGEDFGKVAEARSTGPSGPNKGELGWFTPDMMVAPFAEAVVALKPGEVSQPVQTQFGWHVIRLNETRKVEPPKFEEVREQLAQQVRRERIEAEIARTTGAARVERTEGLSADLLVVPTPAPDAAPPAAAAPAAEATPPDAGTPSAEGTPAPTEAAPPAEASPAAAAEATPTPAN